MNKRIEDYLVELLRLALVREINKGDEAAYDTLCEGLITLKATCEEGEKDQDALLFLSVLKRGMIEYNMLGAKSAYKTLFTYLCRIKVNYGILARTERASLNV